MDASLGAVGEPKRKATYDDVLAAPEHQIAEILDGELFLSPRPASRHALASSVLGGHLISSFHGPPGDPARPGGWWIVFEPELHLGDDVVVPDLAGWRRERMPRFPDTPWFDVAPDWLCETLSPSTARIDRSRKLRIYARAGVSHVWLLDPMARTLEVLALEGGRWVVADVHDGDAIVHAEPFAARALELAPLWID
ncbi:MAG TPA: Uma2 family endonuclease [Candidatus Binatia bacterium]